VQKKCRKIWKMPIYVLSLQTETPKNRRNKGKEKEKRCEGTAKAEDREEETASQRYNDKNT